MSYLVQLFFFFFFFLSLYRVFFSIVTYSRVVEPVTGLCHSGTARERVAAPAAVECGNACLQTTFFVSVFPGLLNSHIN